MYLKKTISSLFILLLFGLGSQTSTAQQKIGYVDSDFILQAMPNYATIQQQLDRMASDWQKELDQLKKDLDEQFRDYQARELLYTNEERQRRREEIVQAEEDLERLRVKYFGPEGDIFLEQEKLMRPLQEKILQAIDDVATAEGYDYVFDIAGEFVFMFRRAQFDLSENVLLELGIDVASPGRQTAPSN
ncbi:OmpH family outer membrane protein [bacterium]|nr:OmpH family outer membrane protein [bacterium]